MAQNVRMWAESVSEAVDVIRNATADPASNRSTLEYHVLTGALFARRLLEVGGGGEGRAWPVSHILRNDHPVAHLLREEMGGDRYFDHVFGSAGDSTLTTRRLCNHIVHAAVYMGLDGADRGGVARPQAIAVASQYEYEKTPAIYEVELLVVADAYASTVPLIAGEPTAPIVVFGRESPT